MTLRVGRIAAAMVGFACLAASAGAFTLITYSRGLSTTTALGWEYNASVGSFYFLDASIGEPGSPVEPFTSVVADFGLTGTSITSGTFTFYTADHDDSLTGKFTGISSQLNGSSYSFNAGVELLAGTGLYAGYTGHGTVSGTKTTFNGVRPNGTLSLRADAVPEPFTLVLGACGLCLAARRRRR